MNNRAWRRTAVGMNLAVATVALATGGSSALAQGGLERQVAGRTVAQVADYYQLEKARDNGGVDRHATDYLAPHGGLHRLRELDFVWTTEEPRGYAFIMQIPERAEPYYAPDPPLVVVHLRHEPTWGPPEDWSWYVSDPNDTGLAHDLTLTWYGQASCPDDLTSLQINGPGGLATQNPLSNPIAGYFEYQSASVDRVKDICVQWAEADNCDPIEPGCQLEETFMLYTDVAAEPGDYIELSGSCASGPLPTAQYLPEIEVRCTRANY